jgi:regulatory protein
MAYCAYQERCLAEVEAKAHELGLSPDETYEALVRLRHENFVNEERYARSYVRGKHNHKHWGRLKIKQGLLRKQVGAKLAQRALAEEIDYDGYLQTLQTLAEAKWQATKGRPAAQRQQQTTQYLVGKGYESSLVYEVVAQLARPAK